MFGIKDGDNMNNNIQLDDIVNGNGEWKHLQPVIRTTFRVLFEVINTQQEQIMAMNDQMKDIRKSVARKPDVEDISQLIKSREIVNNHSVGGLNSTASRMNPLHLAEDIKLCNGNIIQLKAELERKASIRYIDDIVRRKADKTVVDQLVIKTNHSNTHMTLQQSIHKCNLGIEALQDDFQELRSNSYLTDKTIQDAHSKLQHVANIQDVTAVRDECLKRCDEAVSRVVVDKLLDKKVSTGQFDELMSQKADLGLVHSQGTELSATVANHEQVLTILQMKLQELSAYYGNTSASAVAGGAAGGAGLDDLFASTLSSFAPAGLRSPGFIPDNTSTGANATTSRATTPVRTKLGRAAQYTPATGGMHGSTTPAPPVNPAHSLATLHNVTAAVQQGREIGLITGLVDKLENLHVTMTHMTTDVRVNGDRISGVENQLNNYTVSADDHRALEKEVHQCSQTVAEVVSGERGIVPLDAALAEHSARMQAIEKYVGGTPARRRQSRGRGSNVGQGVGGYSTSDTIPATPTVTSGGLSAAGASAIYSGGYGGGADVDQGGFGDNGSSSLSGSLEDVHALLELLGSKIKEHSVILNKVLLHVDQFETYSRSMDDRLVLLEEVNANVVTPLQKFCEISDNSSYANSTNSASTVDISSIKGVLSALGDLDKKVRVLRQEHEEAHLKMTKIGTEQADIRDIVGTATVESKAFSVGYTQLQGRVGELEKLQTRIVSKLKRFPDEVINTVEKRFTQTLLVASQTGGLPGLGDLGASARPGNVTSVDTGRSSRGGSGGGAERDNTGVMAADELEEFHEFVHSVHAPSRSQQSQSRTHHQHVDPPIPPAHRHNQGHRDIRDHGHGHDPSTSIGAARHASPEHQHRSLMKEHDRNLRTAEQERAHSVDRHAAERHPHVPESHHDHYVKHQNDHHTHVKHSHGHTHGHSHKSPSHTHAEGGSGSQYRHRHGQNPAGIASSPGSASVEEAPEAHTLDYIDVRLRELQLEKEKAKAAKAARGRTKSRSSSATESIRDEFRSNLLGVDMLSRRADHEPGLDFDSAADVSLSDSLDSL